jgi:hypothetical protein
MTGKDDCLVIEYSSFENISFRGTIVCKHITVGEFEEFERETQQELFLAEELNKLVDLELNAETK